MYNEEVKLEYTPMEQKQHKKHENDHWGLLRKGRYLQLDWLYDAYLMKVHIDTYDSLSKHDNVLNVLQQIIIFKGNCKKHYIRPLSLILMFVICQGIQLVY